MSLLPFLECKNLPKYLIHGHYTVEGIKGLIKEGGTSRNNHFKENVANLGGKVESFYYAFGSDDIYTIVDLKDNQTAVSLILALNEGGGFAASSTVLLTPEEIDNAAKEAHKVGYKAPGTRNL